LFSLLALYVNISSIINHSRYYLKFVVIGGSRGGQSGHDPIRGFREGPAPSQAAEGIVKGRWIVEMISRFFSLASLAMILKI